MITAKEAREIISKHKDILESNKIDSINKSIKNQSIQGRNRLLIFNPKEYQALNIYLENRLQEELNIFAFSPDSNTNSNYVLIDMSKNIVDDLKDRGFKVEPMCHIIYVNRNFPFGKMEYKINYFEVSWE